ncbi:MAG: preprotein translocase subunit YajC [Planctomycetia bacterium]|nr:preprotein translocase subunit YajC [Planctomycetia bacterium]
MFLTSWILFAQAAADSAAPTSTPTGGEQYMPWVWLLILFGFMWFFLIRPQQNERRMRQQMWDALKLHDEVVTAGGILGVITNIDREEGVVTLRVDETNNVKIRFLLTTIASVVENDPKNSAEK